MKIKEVAELLGVDKSEIVQEVESRRDEFVASGHRIAKKLTAASALDDEVVRHVMASLDQRRQQQDAEEKAAEAKRKREEEERARAAAEMERKKKEEALLKEREELRRKADEELRRKQAMQKAAQQSPPPAPASPPPHAAPKAPSSSQAIQPSSESKTVKKPQPSAPPQGRIEERKSGIVQKPAARQAPQRESSTELPRMKREAPPASEQVKKPQPSQTEIPAEMGAEKKKAKKIKPSDSASLNLHGLMEGGMGPKLEDTPSKRRRRGSGPKQPTEAESAKAKKGKPVGEDPKRKRIRPTQIFQGDLLTDRRGANKGKRGPQGQKKGSGGRGGPHVQEAPKEVTITGDFTVGTFAEKIQKPVNDVMGKLMMMGHMMTINHYLDPEIAEELALEYEIELHLEQETDERDVESYLKDDGVEDNTPRSPVVTIMGHVDHGKTSLLDKIRKSEVAAGEAGGITQHIGAYKVSSEKGDIVFLDTPGHEAFTEMRSRGANITDLVVLVVAANDGVMPQTVEAINHARAAEVPILVAVNKMDVEGANPERVKQELMKHELVAEEYGGDTIVVPVSAITGQGIDELLEYIGLQTDILELQSNPAARPQGSIVESHIDPLRGAVATVLVQRGTLRVGDIFVCGTEWGRVRAMSDDRGRALKEAGPSTPVEILGLRGSPVAGEPFIVLPTESEAREIAERRASRRKTRSQIFKPNISLENLADHMSEDDVLSLNIVLKGDVQGSVEAVAQSLYKIESNRVSLKIIHSAVGSVSTSDVNLAEASGAIIIAFNVGIEPAARNLAEEAGVDIRSYDVIYALIEAVEKAMLGMLAPEYEEKEEGRAQVLQTFRVSKVGTAAGCLVEEGNVSIDHKVRLIRNGAVIWRGKMASLRRVKDDVKSVQSGTECGIGLENFNDVKAGDVIETYSLVERELTLVDNSRTREPEDVKA